MPSVAHCDDVLAFLWRSMDCFLGCFRPRGHRDRYPPHSVLVPNSSPNEQVAEKIRLTSLLAADESEEFVASRESLVRRVGRSELDEPLLEEVKILKACDTLPQTPAEIRKTVKFSEDLEKSEIKMPQSALKTLPQTPVAQQLSEPLPENLDCEYSGRPCSNFESSPETPEESREVETLIEITGKSNVRGPCPVVKASPYPTPRKITDDMQTPGTVFATNMKSLNEGNTRIRSQDVYTVVNPIANPFQLEEQTEKDGVLLEHEGENFLQLGDTTPLISAHRVELCA